MQSLERVLQQGVLLSCGPSTVHADSRRHSSFILELGGDPLTPNFFGVNALHLGKHM